MAWWKKKRTISRSDGDGPWSVSEVEDEFNVPIASVSDGQFHPLNSGFIFCFYLGISSANEMGVRHFECLIVPPYTTLWMSDSPTL